MNIACGIDLFKEFPGEFIRNKNVVLITSSTAVDASSTPVYRVVKRAAGKNLKAIWSLQHGFFMDKQDNMILSDSSYWQEMAVEIRSLYGDTLVPPADWLTGIDMVLVDVLDVGTRVYTFVNHLVMILKELSGKGIEVLVLDRPNPLNGIDLEGPVAQDDFFSIVGMAPVPMRHGLTQGEYVTFASHYHQIDIDLKVIEIKNWQRQDFYTPIWTYPSPNMPTWNTAIVYPGAVLLEGTNISEGRGTTRPFELVGGPYVKNLELVEALNILNLEGVTFVPLFFKPEFSKFADQVCNGFLIHPHDLAKFRSFATYYEIIRLIYHRYPDHFIWKKPPYEFEYERPPIDMINGTGKIRQAIEKNQPYVEIAAEIESELVQFRETIDPYLFYR